MNLDYQSVDSLVDNILGHLSNETLNEAELVVCAPSIFIPRVLERVKGGDISIGGQDCSDQTVGAYTGQISAKMLHESGCGYVIVGHSERRQYNGETSSVVCAKAQQAIDNTLTPIICVGETLEEREAGRAEAVVGLQLRESVPQGVSGQDIVVAYEPVWAIGTGKVASPADVEDMHGFIYQQLSEQILEPENVRILYGGSMKPDNAAALLAIDHVDGGLIGGASLDAESFLSIASCA